MVTELAVRGISGEADERLVNPHTSCTDVANQ